MHELDPEVSGLGYKIFWIALCSVFSIVLVLLWRTRLIAAAL
jgi:hypothetical protein